MAAGVAVHRISRRVLPWPWSGKSVSRSHSSAGVLRHSDRTRIPPSTPTKTTPAMANTTRERSRIDWALGPSARNVLRGASVDPPAGADDPKTQAEPGCHPQEHSRGGQHPRPRLAARVRTLRCGVVLVGVVLCGAVLVGAVLRGSVRCHLAAVLGVLLGAVTRVSRGETRPWRTLAGGFGAQGAWRSVPTNAPSSLWPLSECSNSRSPDAAETSPEPITTRAPTTAITAMTSLPIRGM